MQKLFDTIRKECLPGLWSKGVKLAREERVLVEVRNATEISLRIQEPGRPAAPTVSLYPAEGEWTCDCGAPVDPCHHVAAAVIALHQSGASGTALPERRRVSFELHYRFSIARNQLIVERKFASNDGVLTPLADSLLRLAATSRLPEGFAPTADDVAVDRLLSSMLRQDLLENRMGSLCRHLGSSKVFFDGRPVRVELEPVLPAVSVIDEGKAIVLRVVKPPEVLVVARGVALVAGVLMVAGETELCGLRWERLPLERRFDQSQVGELVLDVLPELQKRLPVEIKSRRLPKRVMGERPRMAFDLTQDDGRLMVLPTLVYGDPPCARIEGGKLIRLTGDLPDRDEMREIDLIQSLRDELNLVPGRAVSVGGRDADRLIDRVRDWSLRHGESKNQRHLGETQLQARLNLDGDRFSLYFEEEQGEGEPTGPGKKSASGVRQASADVVISSWRDGLSIVPLEGGGWAPLPADWLSRFGNQVADLLAARQDDGSVSTAALPTLAKLCEELDEPPPPSLERLRPLLEGFDRLPECPLPDDLRAELRPYQRDGVNWLGFIQKAGLGGVLADDMGLGKTLQALCVLDGKCLVISPKSVVFNWADEIAKFRPGRTIHVYHGAGRELADAHITLTTYATLRLDIELLASREWDVIVLDEAQAIKNPDSQVSRAAYRLKGRHRLTLSGTPVENRLDELWSQFHFTNPGLLGGRKDFLARYADPISKGDGAALARLREKVKPFVLRRLKRDVAPELPPRTEHVLHVELDSDERDTYDAIRAATRRDVAEKLAAGGNVLAALEALLRLRQAACHSGLLPGRTAPSSSKVERLLLSLEHAASDGHKALVFSQWTSLLDLVEPHLTEAKIPYLRLDGGTRDRASVVSGFQDPSGPPVLLVSLKAGGTGLNLTAADHVFLLDPWWNPAVEDQAADRAHRIGQERPVMVHRLVARDTVEEGILALQERKRALAVSALGTGDAALGITREELLALLE